MKKIEVMEREITYCDLCDEDVPNTAFRRQCFNCGKDVCQMHSIEYEIPFISAYERHDGFMGRSGHAQVEFVICSDCKENSKEMIKLISRIEKLEKIMRNIAKQLRKNWDRARLFGHQRGDKMEVWTCLLRGIEDEEDEEDTVTV